ncbi:MAG TPA: FAD-dependent oxidoreductase [Terriglobales bacterium]|nr:FAD-dependent oxidoreductase [Terriglobales bacterium]
MKTWDTILVGGGIIGLSSALELRKNGLSVLLVDRTEPGREASSAAAGMLACCDPHLPRPLHRLAAESYRLYAEFVHEIEDESGMRVDLRGPGTIVLGENGGPPPIGPSRPIPADELTKLEPHLPAHHDAQLWQEKSVDPRALAAAALKAAKHRGVDIASGSPVVEIEIENGRATGVRTAKTAYKGAAIINCAGAWAGQVPPLSFPTRPVKGQMLSVITNERNLLQHVVRSPDVYLVPRSDGRILIGATLENSGFDKRTDPNTIQRLHQAAANLVPELGEARILEDWAGLRPGTPDDMPLLGPTPIPGYFVAAGHFRDGILLAPVTAKIMAAVITGAPHGFDLAPFSPERFLRAA